MNPELMDKAQIRTLQEDSLRSVWPHIVATPFYERRLREAGLEVHDVRSLSDLQKVPFTFKEDVRATHVLERTPLVAKDVYALYSSGGTSGAPTLYVWSEEDVRAQTEVARRILSSVETTSSDLALILAPLSLPVIGHCMVRQFSAVGAGFIPVGQAGPEEVVSLIRSLPITIIATLPTVASRLFEYMRFAMRLDVDEQIQVRQFQLGGDFVSNARRHRLERVWHAKCYDFYGISEVFGPLSGECLCQNGLHFAADYVFVEVLDPLTKQPVPDGESGVAVYTTLWEKGFPLLRYWTEDYVKWTWEPCPCGRNSPRMWFLGRTVDCADIHGRRLFAKDVEEVLLKFPISDEYYCEYTSNDKGPTVQASVEILPDAPLDTQAFCGALESVFGMPVELNVADPGKLPREQVKPKRLRGFPVRAA
jgi:phenylacetate-CoA ligase